MKRILLQATITIIALLTICASTAHAQYNIDSLRNNKAYQILHIGAPLVIVGTLVRPVKAGFQDIRNTSFKDFRYGYDDYTQYLPGIATVALKACGVESRSSWGRMLTSNALGFLTTTALVNGAKYTVRDLRPDGSSRNSFPSGHTATSFAMATMLHMEYGGRSPWYSIGGYTVATVTGISRILNNRHWLSDVIAGAGIGIASIHFGYWLGDIIFRDKGLNTDYPDNVSDIVTGNSFIGINALYRLNMNKKLTDGATAGNGSHTSLEGAWYFCRNIGAGGSVGIGNIPVILEGKDIRTYNNYLSAEAGIYGSTDIVKNLLSAEAKITCGYATYIEGDMDEDRNGVSVSTGVSLKFKSTAYFTSSLYVGYSAMPSPVGSTYLHSAVIGLGANMSF